MKFKKYLILFFALFLAFLPVAEAESQQVTASRYKQLGRDLQNLRGLKFKKPVNYRYKSAAALKSYITAKFKEEMTPKKIRDYNATLGVFGLVPENFDSYKLLISIHSEQVAGLYDPEVKVMYLREGSLPLTGQSEEQKALLQNMGFNQDDMVLIHEMDHSLQDQYFNLYPLIRKVKKYHNDDMECALQSLIEGDAYLIMFKYMFDKVGGGISGTMDIPQIRDRIQDTNIASIGGNSTLSKAPLFFRRYLLFPYAEGMVFVDALYKRGGWKMVNGAFTRLPLSTEQILHPDKYFKNERPIMVTFSSLPSVFGDWRLYDENVAGESFIRIVMEQFLSLGDFRKIAQGWGGDRYRIYGKGKEIFLVWYTSWDNKNEAKEFFRAYLDLLKTKYPKINWVKKAANVAYLGQVGNKYCYLAIRGKDVLVIEKVPSNLAGSVIGKSWNVDKKPF